MSCCSVFGGEGRGGERWWGEGWVGVGGEVGWGSNGEATKTVLSGLSAHLCRYVVV